MSLSTKSQRVAILLKRAERSPSSNSRMHEADIHRDERTPSPGTQEE